MYTLLAKPTVEKDLRPIPKRVLENISKAIKSLAIEPRQSQTEKLKGADGYRIRIGDYRILYAIDDAARTVTIHRVRHRKEAYR